MHSVIPAAPYEPVSAIIQYGEFDQPPGFFLLLHYWFKCFAYNEFYARLLAAVLGVFGVLSMYFLGKEFKNATVGLVASFITALNWFHLYYSQEVRFYGMLFLLTALSYLFFIKSYKTNHPVYYGLYALTGIALLYTHYFGIFVLASQFLTAIWLIFIKRITKKGIIYVIITGLIIIAGYLPWIPVVLDDHANRVHWVTLPDWGFLGLYYYTYLGKDPFLAVLFLVLSFLFARSALRKQNEENKFTQAQEYLILLCLWIGLSYLLPLIYSFIRSPIIIARYTIVVLPAIFIAVSLGFDLIQRPWLRSFIVSAIGISTVINFIFFNKYYTTVTKNQFREMTQTMIQRNTSGIPMYSDQAWHYSFYFRQYKAPFEPIDTKDIKFEEALNEQKQVWVLQGHILKGVDDNQQNYLDQYFTLKDKIILYGTAAFLYERK
jgi:uncharacterized membrane protein